MYDLEELRTEIAEEGPADAYYETLVWRDHDADTGVMWVCNQCANPLPNDTEPCPDHAPRDVPGLRLVDCEETPRHMVWVIAGDHGGYGVPCPPCEWMRTRAELDKAQKRDRCYHWPWRRWRLTRRLAGHLYASGLAAHGGGYILGGGHGGCTDRLPGGWHPRRERPYILWISRNTWRCWLKGHRRGEHVGFGFCGKCVPWPCCAATTADHADGCSEAVYDRYPDGGSMVATITVTAPPEVTR